MTRRSTPAFRRLVLGAAFAAALAIGFAPHSGSVRAMAQSGSNTVAQAEPQTRDAKTPDARPDKAPDAKREAEVEVTIDRGVVIHKGDKRVRIEGLGADSEYESFEEFVRHAPWLAGLVFLVVTLVFLAPVLVIVLIVWYKIRKNRMLNETMLKLAERGVMPPAEAMEALGSTRLPPAPPPAPGVPIYEQTKLLRQRSAWSDLRKGVMLVAVGLALTAYSVFDDGSANPLGLVLLFVGVGYCVLWFFETREPGARARGANPAGGSPPPGGV